MQDQEFFEAFLKNKSIKPDAEIIPILRECWEMSVVANLSPRRIERCQKQCEYRPRGFSLEEILAGG